MDIMALVARLTLDKTDYDSGLDSASEKAQGFGAKLKKGLGVAAAAGAAALTAVAGATTAITKSVISGASEVATFGDNIDKASQKIGFSAEAYQEWDAVLQHSGSSIDSVTMGLKTLSAKAQSGSDAFTKLGISQKEAASMTKEQLFERTITALQNVQDENERAALATELLGKSAMELGPLLNTSAADTKAMRDRVHELGGVLSDEAVKAAAAYQDSLQDMQTAFAGVKRNLLSELLPGMTQVMDGLTELLIGNGTEKLTEGIKTMANKLGEIIPRVIDTGTDLIIAFADAIIDNLPVLVEKVPIIIDKLVSAILKNLPKLISAGVQIVQAVAEGILKAVLGGAFEPFKGAIEALLPVILGVVAAIKAYGAAMAVMQTVQKAVAIFKALTTATEGASAAQAILNTVMSANPIGLVVAAIAGLIAILGTLYATNEDFRNGVQALWEGIKNFVTGAVKAIGKVIETVFGAAYKVVVGLVGGIKSVFSAGLGAVKATADEKLSNIKRAFEENGGGIKGVVAAGWEAIKGAYTFGFSVIDKLTGGKLSEIKDAVFGAFKNVTDSALNWGKDLIQNFINGINNMWQALKQKVADVGSLIKSFLGFSEPEQGPLSNFHTYAPDMMALFAKGITDNEKLITDAIDDAFDIHPTINQNVNTSSMGQEIVIPKETTDSGKSSAVMEVDRTVFARLIYKLYNEEAGRIGVQLTGGAT